MPDTLLGSRNIIMSTRQPWFSVLRELGAGWAEELTPVLK